LSKLILTLIVGSLGFAACSKDDNILKAEPVTPCQLQTENPAGRSYAAGSVVEYNCTDKHCGLLPLSLKNYWVYQDSLFYDGVYLKTTYDTLRFSSEKSLTDGLVWWESNMVIGLPDVLYTNDSAFFSMADRMFTPDIKDARKDFSVPAGDSLKYLTSFEDAAAMGRSLKLEGTIKSPAGSFDNCVYFEKNARNYRRDQVYFKPGIGVIKYIQEKAPMGSPLIKLQQVSTLVAMHLE
jgi:hypothetical protein